MVKTEDKLIPLAAATEHYAAAYVRGQNEGTKREFDRVISLLKKSGHYDAVLTLKKLLD